MALNVTFGTAPARTHSGGPRERSEAQQEFDRLVADLCEAWVEAGKPSKSAEKPAAYIPVADEDELKDVEKRLRSAGTYHNMSVRFYDYHKAEDGTVHVVVSAENRREYKPRTPKPAAE